MAQIIGLNLTRNEMKQIFGGFYNPCYPITCCFPPNSPDCVAGPCTGVLEDVLIFVSVMVSSRIGYSALFH